ncbi:hypothetical protein DFH09DRAFT_1479826 [Mycena vulgaris]|nr:hypothetical protein DFH09DRAFT_1479826 [Mycena vulgaris]
MQQTLADLLDRRDICMSLNPTKQTARFPIFSGGPGPVPLALDSHIAYVACQTLRHIATATDETLWDIYGDIISKWPGSAAPGVLKSWEEGKQWVETFRSQTDTTQTIQGIRKALATLSIIFVPSTSLPAFAQHTRGDLDEITHSLALHHRSSQGSNIIYIMPFLPRVEALLRASLHSADKGSVPGHDWDVAVVSAAKAMVYGASYCTPPMIQGAFSPPLLPSEHATPLPSDTIQGEAGDWYEVSHYGAFLSPALVCPTSFGGLAESHLRLTGYHSEGARPFQLRYLLPNAVHRLAEQVHDGSFISTAPIFIPDHTFPVSGFVLELTDMDPQDSTVPPPTLPDQTVFRHTSIARRSGPHTLPNYPTKSVDDISDIRMLGYGNLRGVLRGP